MALDLYHWKSYAAYKVKPRKEIHVNKLEGPRLETYQAARAAEWDKWLSFDAAEVLPAALLEKTMTKHGINSVTPMRWVDVDKNESLRVPGTDTADIPEKPKSRLCVRGDREQTIEDMRTDSPTASIYAFNLVCAWAASHRARLFSGDAPSAYLQQDNDGRYMICTQPPGGIPGVPSGDYLLVKVRAYGSKDAGRSWYHTVQRRMAECSEKGRWVESSYEKAFYRFIDEDGKVKGAMITHVDDFLVTGFGANYEQSIAKLAMLMSIEQWHSSSFRYCGKEVHQDDDFTITVEQSTNSADVPKISLTADQRRNPEKRLDGKTLFEVRNRLGRLSWLARKLPTGLGLWRQLRPGPRRARHLRQRAGHQQDDHHLQGERQPRPRVQGRPDRLGARAHHLVYRRQPRQV